MSRQHVWKAWNLYVTHVCGLDSCAIALIDYQGAQCDASIGNIGSFHYKNGCGASVRNGLIGCNHNSIDVVRRHG